MKLIDNTDISYVINRFFIKKFMIASDFLSPDNGNVSVHLDLLLLYYYFSKYLYVYYYLECNKEF